MKPRMAGSAAIALVMMLGALPAQADNEWLGYIHFEGGVKKWTKGRYDDAIGDFMYCVKFAPQFPGCARVLDQSHYYLGTIYQIKKNYGRAAQEYQTAIAVNPRYVAPRLKLAQIMSQSGDYAQAAGQLEKAVEINPKSASAHAALARVYKDMKEYDLAWKHAREAEKNGGDVKEILVSLKRVSKEPAEPQPETSAGKVESQ